MSDIIVIDDFLTPEDQAMVKGVLFGEQFPWFFRPDITYGYDAPEGKKAPAISHVFRDNCHTLSPYFNQFAPIAHLGASRFGYEYKDILKCRSFMQFPLHPDTLPSKLDFLHVDTNLKHLVVLYYVCDSDGDTVIVTTSMTQAISSSAWTLGITKRYTKSHQNKVGQFCLMVSITTQPSNQPQACGVF
jgi:hypothetical protein